MFIDEAPASENVSTLYERSTQDSGYVSNFLRVWSWRPDVFDAFYESRRLVMQNTNLSKEDIAIVNATAAATRRDSYCSLAWGAKVADLVSPEAAREVLLGERNVALDERKAALLDWTRAVVADPNGTTQQDVDRLRRVGLTDREIFEATFLAAARIAFTAVNSALGASPDRQLESEAPAVVLESVSYGRPVTNASTLP